MSAKRADAQDSDPNDVTAEELREFLAGGADGQARPEFKEALRRKLWQLLQDERRGADPADAAD